MTDRPRNAAKALARLNVKVANYSIGSGGNPADQETPQMIAAALGAVARRGPGQHFAVSVLLMKWWPATHYATEQHRHRAIVETSGPRIGLPRQVAVPVPTRHGLPVTVLRPVNTITLERTLAPRAVQTLNTLNAWVVKKLRAGAWPIPDALVDRINARPAFWQQFTGAVVDEFCYPAQCAACFGYGEVLKITVDKDTRLTKSKVEACPVCEGKGKQPRTAEKRARAVGIRRDDFKLHLREPYEWLLNVLVYLEYTAARAFVRALSDGDDHPDA